MERVILTTGGTGGHIFPALAVAEEIRARNPLARILFVGGRRGAEAELAARAGLEFVSLPVSPILGRGLKAVAALAGLGRGILGAFRILQEFKPDVVLGFGGYAAFSSVMAAVLTKRQTAIHEQNSIPGLTNRVLGRYVKRIFLSFPDTRKIFDPAKTMITGNPVRAAIRHCADMIDKAPQPTAKRPDRLLILGGSQGAMAVNTAICDALPELARAKVEIRHQAGKLDLNRTREAYNAKGQNQNAVSEFIDDMAEAYAWADLVVCRAGATTLAEVTVAGKPCIFIPFPFATHNHQVENARFMERAGAALCIEQREFEHRNLAAAILALLGDRTRLESMGKAARTQGKPYAATVLASQLEIMTERKQHLISDEAKWIKE